jgi:hypothetical protein
MARFLCPVFTVLLGTKAALEASIGVFFPQTTVAWVLAMPYRRKPAWYEKRVSCIFCYGFCFIRYVVSVFRAVSVASNQDTEG